MRRRLRDVQYNEVEALTGRLHLALRRRCVLRDKARGPGRQLKCTRHARTQCTSAQCDVCYRQCGVAGPQPGLFCHTPTATHPDASHVTPHRRSTKASPYIPPVKSTGKIRKSVCIPPVKSEKCTFHTCHPWHVVILEAFVVLRWSPQSPRDGTHIGAIEIGAIGQQCKEQSAHSEVSLEYVCTSMPHDDFTDRTSEVRTDGRMLVSDPCAQERIMII